MTHQGTRELTENFETYRGHLRAVAYRMLGSVSEADDAVQEAWLRLNRCGAADVANLGGWLTTVVARVCLDALRSRSARREDPLDLPLQQLKVQLETLGDPEQEAVMADAIGGALLIVLDSLPPAERLAYVLHDVFAMAFQEIAQILDRTPAAAKKLASRARQRMQGRKTTPRQDRKRRTAVAGAFLAASRTGDMHALIAVLDPAAVRQADHYALPPGGAPIVRGAERVAGETQTNSGLARFATVARVNGRTAIVVSAGHKLRLAILLTIRQNRITAIEMVAEPARLRGFRVALP